MVGWAGRNCLEDWSMKVTITVHLDITDLVTQSLPCNDPDSHPPEGPVMS